MTLHLEAVTPDNVGAALKLAVRPEQQGTVAPVAVSLAEAYASRDTAWPRLVYDSARPEAPVAFVMANFDPAHEIEFFRCGIWRLLVDAGAQGRGYGRFAVGAVAAEARRRGEGRITVSWVPHEHGPEPFYRTLGFVPTGDHLEGEVIAELALS